MGQNIRAEAKNCKLRYKLQLIMNILVGHEESQNVTRELRRLGHNAYSCDLKPCSGGHPEWHLKMDVFEAIGLMNWDAGLFFPDCTYLTISAEWAYKDPDFNRYPEVGYHQRVKPNTLVGDTRRKAREDAVAHVKALWNSGIPIVAIENPVGRLSSLWQKPTQIIQPYHFGDDACKKTCLWLKGLQKLTPTNHIKPRYVNGAPRWGNQTDVGQNKLPPSKNRAKLRSKTYPGIARAMAEQWFGYGKKEAKSEKPLAEAG
jgi:hypothetical protein